MVLNSLFRVDDFSPHSEGMNSSRYRWETQQVGLRVASNLQAPFRFSMKIDFYALKSELCSGYDWTYCKHSQYEEIPESLEEWK